MLQRIRRAARGLSSRGGWRRHPYLAGALALLVLLLLIGLAMRPL